MQIKDQIQGKILSYLEKSVFNAPCSKVASVSGVDKVVVFEAALGLAGLLAVLLVGAATIVNLICFVYPALSSVKVVELRAEAQCSKWLVYWILYFAVQTIEEIAPSLFSNIPFYFWIKLGFFVWCYHPATEGTLVVFELTTPLRNSVMDAIDTFLQTYLPSSSSGNSNSNSNGSRGGKDQQTAERVQPSTTALLVRVDGVELSEDLLRETAVVSGAAPEDKRPMFVEISLVAGPSREALGPKYKTQPLSGRELNFAYTLTLVPSALVSTSSDVSDAALCFAVKEKCTFSDDIVVAELSAPLDPALLRLSPEPAADPIRSNKVAINLSTSTGGAKLMGSIENTLI